MQGCSPMPTHIPQLETAPSDGSALQTVQAQCGRVSPLRRN